VTNPIDEVVGPLIERLEEKNAAREQALLDARRLTRSCALTIRALHRGDIEEAHGLLGEAGDMVARIKSNLASEPDLYWSGYVQDAQKEYAEAAIVARLLAHAALPTPGELGIEVGPFLNGLGEAASEMRRFVLDAIRHGGAEQHREGERALGYMDDIYVALIAVDFPDALTGGLRRTTDLVRSVLERTRGDLTMSLRQAQLEQALGVRT
jgi:translin